MGSENVEFVRSVRQRLFPEKKDNDPIPGLDKGFLITKHLAWELRSLGWGLVKAKPGSENNFDGYTTDVIAKSDGYHIDVLGDSGGSNFAAWQPHDNPEHMAAIKPRWVEAIEPTGIFFPPNQPPSNSNENRLRALEIEVARLRDNNPNSRLTGRKIALRSMANGKIVCAEEKGNRALIANRDEPGNWEEFEIIEIL